jgi:hypothetical protein
MSVSPSPEHIEICTPPDSPKIVFDGQEWSTPEVKRAASQDTMVTPPKALRAGWARRGVKRRRPDSVDVTIGNVPTGGEGTNFVDVFGEYSRDLPGGSEETNTLDLEGSSLPNDSGLITEPELVDPYEHYTDAALANCCGFFQISKTLFVVQGWDIQGKRSTVCWRHFQGL